MSRPTAPRDLASWPRSLRRAVDEIATMLMQAFHLARARALESPSPTVRALAERNGLAWESELQGREIAVFRRRLAAIEPLKRPHVPPQERFEVIQIMRLRGWSIEEAARFFVLHPNTLREWLRRFDGPDGPKGFFGKAPFNRISDAARWLVHEIRALCPEKEFGTRWIAMAIVRAEVKLSRSSVQRILREKKPERPDDPAAAATQAAPAAMPHAILRPRAKNRTWHLDLATMDLLWMRFYVAAIVDGFSRKLLALRVYRDAPATRNVVALVHRTVRGFGGAPRFLVTDHGAQFRKTFKQALRGMGVTLVKGRVRSCTFNGKAERFFRTLRLWERVTIFAWKTEWIQRKLDSFRAWYNAERPQWTLAGRTPEEAWTGAPPPEPAPCRSLDPVQPVFRVTRRGFRGDPRLSVIEIGVTHRLKRTA